MKLEDLVPQKSKFKLSATGDVEYHLREITLQDKLWIQHEYPGDRLKQVFEGMAFDQICRIAYHQIEDADKREHFRKRVVKFENENGEEAQHEIGGLNLFYFLVTGIPEQLKIVECLLHTLGISEQMLDSIKEEELKKKSTPEMDQTGPQSSTSFLMSTDGQPNIS